MTTTRKTLKRIQREIRYFKAILIDPRTPRSARWLIAGGIAYLISPFDLVPDFIPVIGQIDDLLIVPTLIWIGALLVPEEVKRDARRRTRLVHLEKPRMGAHALCETEALRGRFGIRIRDLDLHRCDAEKVSAAILDLVFEHCVVVLSSDLSRAIFEPLTKDEATIDPEQLRERRGVRRLIQVLDASDARGELQFVDLRAACDALSAAQQRAFGSLRVRRACEGDLAAEKRLGAFVPAYLEDPLVLQHPVTRQKMISPYFDAAEIVGLPEDRSAALLDELRRHVFEPRFQYVHPHASEEAVIWDATSTLQCKGLAPAHVEGDRDRACYQVRLRLEPAGPQSIWTPHETFGLSPLSPLSSSSATPAGSHPTGL